MKIFKTLFVCAFLVTLVSCGNDDDSSDADASLISGSWDMSGLDYTGSSTSDAGDSSFTGVGQDFTAVFTFDENPNDLTIEGSYAVELTTMAGGQTVTQVVGSEVIGGSLEMNNNTTWSINGDQLTVTDGEETQVLTVTTLNNNNLVLSYSDTVEINQNGFMQTSTVSVVYSFTR